MNANDDTPRKGENVTVAQDSKRDACYWFLDGNLQLVADKIHGVRRDLGEREPDDLRRDLKQLRAELAAIEEMLPTRTLDELEELTEWRCRYCGNVMLRKGRPTRCLQCRRGEHENGQEPLTERVDR